MNTEEKIAEIRTTAHLQIAMPPLSDSARFSWSVAGNGTGEYVDIGYGDTAETLERIGYGAANSLDEAINQAHAAWQKWAGGKK